MTGALRHVVGAAVAAIALLALPAGAPAAVAPPYDVTVVSPNVLRATPAAGSSTLAVQVQRTASGVEFTPAAASAPACTSTLLKTTCADGLIASELQLQGGLLDVDVDLHGVTTNVVRLTGGTGSDAMIVDADAGANHVGRVAVNPGTGNDSLTVSGNVNAVQIVDGADAVIADPGGDDRYDVNSTSAAIGTLSLGDGNDVASSKSPNLTLDGGPGDDTLSGAGPLLGNAGSDRLEPSALGKVAAGADGAGDIDTLSYSLVGAPLTLAKSGTDVAVGGDGVTKTGIERLEGGTAGDTLIGTGAQDVLSGGDGDDTIDGRGGGDVLDGGPGTNTVTYANGPSPVTVDLSTGTGGVLPLDSLTGFTHVITGPGADTVTGTSRSEVFSLGDGGDVLSAAAGNHHADGGGGDDTLRGGLGSDTLDGGGGADTVTYDERGASEPLNVTLATPGGDGAAGENDTLVAVESVVGGASNDTLVGDASNNALYGGPGVNTLDGQAGDDQLFGGNDRDVITGGPGNDALFGAGDDDSLNAFDAAKPDVDIVSCGASLDDDAQVDATDTVTECEFSSRADVPVPVDDDQDGFVGGFDCDDHNPARNQGATDVPGDGIDQDCDGFDTPVPFVDYGLSAGISKPKGKQRGIKFTRLRITRLPPDRTVVVTCKSAPGKTGRCPFGKATRKPTNGQVSLTTLFKSRRLAPGAKVEFRVTAPKFNGRVRRFTVKRASLRDQELCLVAPRTTPSACPSGEEL
jgi:Ca2+-binding RTX toxin-like protein